MIHAAVAEAKKRNWKMNVAVADSGGNLVAFQRMDGAMLASIQIAEHKARAATTFRRPTKVFEDGINLMHLNYLLAFDGVIASRGGIPLIEQGKIIDAIGCSGGTDSQDEVVSKAGRRHQGSRRRHLARQLYGLRSGLYRSGGKNSAAPQQSLWAKSVTYVLGTFCYPCLRAGQAEKWSGRWDSNPRVQLGKLTISQQVRFGSSAIWPALNR